MLGCTSAGDGFYCQQISAAERLSQHVVARRVLLERRGQCDDQIARINQVGRHCGRVGQRDLRDRARDRDNGRDPVERIPDRRRLRHSHVVRADLRAHCRLNRQSVAGDAHEGGIEGPSVVIADGYG